MQVAGGTVYDETAMIQRVPDDSVSVEHGIHMLKQSITPEAMSFSASSYPPSSTAVSSTDILPQIQEWLEDRPFSSSVLWLHGLLKAGKSVSAQMAVELCRDKKQFGGSFFFRRGGIVEDQTQSLFSTLAYQLAFNIPGLLDPINRIVCLDPSLPTKSMATQFQSLIVEAFAQYTPPSTLLKPVIILDIDECSQEESQLEILRIVARSAGELNLPIRFIITSRPQPHIHEMFDRDPLYPITRRISVGDRYDSTDRDTSSQSDIQDHHSLPFLHKFLPSSRNRQHVRHRRPETYSVPSFPRLVSVQRSNGNAESYSRSLLFSGHGFPVWYPGGDLGKSVEYLHKGLSIGDVGILDREGIFDFYFNIFRPSDDPVHSHSVPREFQPISPSLASSEFTHLPDYFKPGHIFTSKGVKVTHHAKDPLDISFSSTEQEGGILVLPQGGSREDLISTDRFHDFARKNAPHWYQVINGYGGIVHTNGTLLLVTGCDKAKDWAVASFPSHAGNGPNSVDIRYTWQPNYGPPWTDKGTARTKFHAPPSSSSIPFDANSLNQCVFVRGIRISLSDSSWEKTMPHLPSARLYYTYLLNSPSNTRLLFDSIRVWLQLRLSEQQAMKKLTSSRLQLFHPNFIIGQVLLEMCPGADVALVNDSVWCSLSHSEYGTITDVNNLVTKVFEKYNPVEQNGIAKLVAKSEDETDTTNEDAPAPTKITRANQLWSLLPSLRQPSTKKWVKHVSAAEHATLF